MLKECKKCKEIKSIDLFGKNRANKSGYDSYCRLCRNKITKATYEKNHGGATNKEIKRLRLIKAHRLNKITKYGIDMVEIFDENKNHLSDIDLSKELNGY